MSKFLKFLAYLGVFLLFLSIGTISLIDLRVPEEKAFYQPMMARIDSLSQALSVSSPSSIKVGIAKVSITPDSAMALAGYGARKPKEFDGVFDSVFVRSIIIENETKKVAILSADLLIVHPEITSAFHQKLKEIGWGKENVFLSATHTHSSIGQWAPGLVGGLFAGDYDEKVAGIIADRMIKSILIGQEELEASSMGFSSSQNPELVFNRLVRQDGDEDDFLKNLTFRTERGDILFSTFSAHATCLTSHSRKLSGDHPAYFHKHLQKDTSILFSVYSAGAVGSMGPQTPDIDQFDRTKFIGVKIAESVSKPESLVDSIEIASFRIPLNLGKPQFKISKNLILKPYLFNYAFGDEQAEISGLLLENVLLIGTPCDFSGELALPLYEYAAQRGLELIITSFNGGYSGYITKDEWFDLEKYETRTMNWYGPGNGKYFSDIIKKLIDAVDANN